MAALEMSHHHIDIDDIEEETHHHRSTGSESSYFSDAEEGSSYSQFYSTRGGSYDDYSFNCASDHGVVLDGVVLENSGRVSSVSDCSVEVVEIEGGEVEIKEAHSVKVEKDCRICHLGLESNSRESGAAIELGCSCKDDLAAAHKHCAEAWFKIKGNKTCEICHSVARNVVGPNDTEFIEQSNETNSATTTTAAAASIAHSETQSSWQGHRFLNFLLACMVFAFVISWLFHFNVPS